MRRLMFSAGIGLAALSPVPAAAQSAYDNPNPPQVEAAEVLGVRQTRPQSVSVATAPSQSLPVTGTDVAGLVAIGGGAIVVGSLLRRRRLTVS